MRFLVEHALANAAAATALAVAAVLIGRVVRRPAVRHALWVIVLVRLLVPPVWTVAVPVPEAEPPDAPAAASANVGPLPKPAPAFDPDWQPTAAGDAPAWPLAAPPSAEPADPAPEPLPSVSAFTVAGILWLVGSAVVFLVAARRIRRFKRALRDAAPADAALQRRAAELARDMGLRHCPDVFLVPGRLSPAVWMPGLVVGRAKLILPAGLLAVLDADQRAAVLAHELAHLRRGDPWVRWLELVVTGLYWWFPPVAWFRRRLRAAEEECCDLWVVAAVGRRRAYATALVETAAFLGDSGPVPALASGAGPVEHLQRRVAMIMRATWPAGLTRLGLAAVLGLGGLGLAFGPAVAQDRGPGDEPKRERGRDDEPKRDRPRDPDPRREAGDREGIEKLRAELDQARKQAEEAMRRMRQAEEALARAEGRPVPPLPDARRDRGGRDPGPGDRRPGPDAPPRGPRPENPVPPAPPAPPNFPGRPGAGPGPDLREMQMQIEELRRAMEQMRQELRRERGDRREPEPPARNSRPGERRDDREPKRP